MEKALPVQAPGYARIGGRADEGSSPGVAVSADVVDLEARLGHEDLEGLVGTRAIVGETRQEAWLVAGGIGPTPDRDEREDRLRRAARDQDAAPGERGGRVAGPRGEHATLHEVKARRRGIEDPGVVGRRDGEAPSGARKARRAIGHVLDRVEAAGDEDPAIGERRRRVQEHRRRPLDDGRGAHAELVHLQVGVDALASRQDEGPHVPDVAEVVAGAEPLHLDLDGDVGRQVRQERRRDVGHAHLRHLEAFDADDHVEGLALDLADDADALDVVGEGRGGRAGEPLHPHGELWGRLCRVRIRGTGGEEREPGQAHGKPAYQCQSRHAGRLPKPGGAGHPQPSRRERTRA